MAKINSREKGKRGERFVANFLKEYGYDTRRGQQYCGSNGDADVIGLPGIHIEVKFVEKLDLLAAMKQSAGDARGEEYPLVFHKKNRQQLLVTMRTQDFIDLVTGDYVLLPETNFVTLSAMNFMKVYQAVEGRWQYGG